MSVKLRLETLLDKTYRPVHGEFITRLVLRLRISDLAESLPLHICLLIDKSMSMSGAKMQSAKASATRLVEALRPEDKLSLITFGTSVEALLEAREMDDAGKASAMQTLSAITPGGVTRLDMALPLAYQLLESSHDYMNMALLLSDGAPTTPTGYVLEDPQLNDLRGTMAEAVRQHGIITSTIGLGDAVDCLASFLEASAETGMGVFYHQQDPTQLAERFIEELDRVKTTAVTETVIHLGDLAGRVRKAAAITPDLRELQLEPAKDGRYAIEAGALQKGEEHVFLLEIVTPDGVEPGKQKLCDVAVAYRLEGEPCHQDGLPPIIERTAEDSLLNKPGHDDVERYKAMYGAYRQTQFAAENVRQGGDTRKTKALLQSAAKTTRALGNAKQTKLLEELANTVDAGGALSENQLTEMATAARKTRVLA